MTQFSNICCLIFVLMLLKVKILDKDKVVNENDSSFLKNNNLYLYLVVIFSFIFIRIIGLGSIPGGVNQDEAMSAVDALALSKYGTDRFGTFLPAHFTAWGYGQMSTLLAYLTVPFIKIFGFNTTVIRLPMLLASLAGAGAVFVVAKKVFDERIAFITFIFMLINPWHFMQSRWAIDCNIFPHMFIIGFCLLVLCLWNGKYLYFSMIFFALCMYSYGVSFYMVPLFLILSCLCLLYYKKVNVKQCLWSALIYFGISWPIYITMMINFFQLKTVKLPFVTMPYFEHSIRSKDILFFSEHPIEQLRHNILSLIYATFLQKPDSIWNAIDDFGTMYKFAIPFVIVGIAIAIKIARKGENERQKLACRLLLIYWGCSIALGIFINSVNINRINIIYYSHIIFAGIGLNYLIKRWKLAAIFILGVFAIQSTLFFSRYFTIWNDQMNDVFYEDFIEAVDFAGDLACDYYYITPDIQYDGSANVSEIITLYTLKVDAKYFQGETNTLFGTELPYSSRFHYENGDYENLNNWDNTCYIFKTINRSYFHDDAFKIKVFGDYSIAVPIQNATF